MSVRTAKHPDYAEVSGLQTAVTGATGFVGAHVVRALAGAGAEVRAVVRDPQRLVRLGDEEVEAVRADVLDRTALRRAFEGAEIVFHVAGVVGSRPVKRVWEVNALGPRVAVEAAAAAGVRRVVVTSSVAGIGPAPEGEIADEDTPYSGAGLGLTYMDSKHEGEAEALAAGARLGIEVVVVNPSYVLGVPVDRTRPGETSTRTIGHYLRGRLPGVVDGGLCVVDVEDVARGHVRAAERGRPGRRYVLGGHNTSWPDLIEKVAKISGIRHPVAVIPREAAGMARVGERLGIPQIVSAEGYVLMAQNWRYSSRRARSELGYRPRSLERTLRATVEWYLELIESGTFSGPDLSRLGLAAAGLRASRRLGLLTALRPLERRTGRRFVI